MTTQTKIENVRLQSTAEGQYLAGQRVTPPNPEHPALGLPPHRAAAIRAFCHGLLDALR